MNYQLNVLTPIFEWLNEALIVDYNEGLKYLKADIKTINNALK